MGGTELAPVDNRHCTYTQAGLTTLKVLFACIHVGMVRGCMKVHMQHIYMYSGNVNTLWK